MDRHPARRSESGRDRGLRAALGLEQFNNATARTQLSALKGPVPPSTRRAPGPRSAAPMRTTRSLTVEVTDTCLVLAAPATRARGAPRCRCTYHPAPRIRRCAPRRAAARPAPAPPRRAPRRGAPRARRRTRRTGRRRPVEQAAAMVLQLVARQRIEALEQPLPGAVAHLRGARRRIDDVAEQDVRHRSISGAARSPVRNSRTSSSSTLPIIGM